MWKDTFLVKIAKCIILVYLFKFQINVSVFSVLVGLLTVKCELWKLGAVQSFSSNSYVHLCITTVNTLFPMLLK